jgi:hypothetical protein
VTKYRPQNLTKKLGKSNLDQFLPFKVVVFNIVFWGEGGILSLRHILTFFKSTHNSHLSDASTQFDLFKKTHFTVQISHFSSFWAQKSNVAKNDTVTIFLLIQ